MSGNHERFLHLGTSGRFGGRAGKHPGGFPGGGARIAGGGEGGVDLADVEREAAHRAVAGQLGPAFDGLAVRVDLASGTRLPLRRKVV